MKVYFTSLTFQCYTADGYHGSLYARSFSCWDDNLAGIFGQIRTYCLDVMCYILEDGAGQCPIGSIKVVGDIARVSGGSKRVREGWWHGIDSRIIRLKGCRDRYIEKYGYTKYVELMNHYDRCDFMEKALAFQE